MARPEKTFNTGKGSELIFHDRMTEQNAFVFRFEDYKDINFKAGSNTPNKAVGARPSDFIVSLNGATFYSEVKSMECKTTFSFSMITKQQWKTAFKVVQTKGLYFFFVHLRELDEWYMIPAKEVISCDKKSFNHKDLRPFRITNQFN